MKYLKSVGAVIFYKRKKKIEYLLLHYGSKENPKHWDFVRGTMEKNETEIETAKREIEEETGLKNLKFIPGFKEREKFFFRDQKGQLILKTAILFLAQSKKKKIKLSWEHCGYQWLVYPKAIKLLTYKNSKQILKKANLYLKNKFY